MNLSFHPTFWNIFITIAVMVAGVWFAVLACKRNTRPLTRKLEYLRLFILACFCTLLFNPEWIQTVHPTQKPKIGILTDKSGSMATLDVETGGGEVISREQFATAITDELDTQKLQQSHVVEQLQFGIKPDGNPLPHTNLARPLAELLNGSDNLQAVIMLTDGGHNTTESVFMQAQRMQSRSIPLFIVPTGSAVPLPDLQLNNVNAPSYGLMNETVQIPFTLKSSLLQDIETTITLRSKQTGKIVTKRVHLPAQSELQDSILWKITTEGNDELELQLPVHAQERIDSNNTVNFAINGKKENIKVLLIDSLPRWEYRFLRNALYRDPGVEVHTLLYHPALQNLGEGPGYLTKFPDKTEELAQYDVIFLGDIGTGAKGLTQEQAELIKEMVTHHAAGLVFLPGSQGKQHELYRTVLGELLPVVPDDEQAQGVAQTYPSPLVLTADGRESLLTKLADSEAENDDIWRTLPGFSWFAPTKRVKAGATVLATHPTAKNTYGRLPLIVTQSVGSGKVLFMGTDGAWRWRRGVEDKYHYRFWSQIAGWMSYQRNMAVGQRIRLVPNMERPQSGDTVALTAMVADQHGSPLQQGDVFLDITTPDGSIRRIQMVYQPDTWGVYTANVAITQPGTWQFAATTGIEGDIAAKLALTTANEQVEKIGEPLNETLIKELCSISGGHVVAADHLQELLDHLGATPPPKPLEIRIPLCGNPYVLGGLVGLLCLFWVGRKLNGTI